MSPSWPQLPPPKKKKTHTPQQGSFFFFFGQPIKKNTQLNRALFFPFSVSQSKKKKVSSGLYFVHLITEFLFSCFFIFLKITNQKKKRKEKKIVDMNSCSLTLKQPLGKRVSTLLPCRTLRYG